MCAHFHFHQEVFIDAVLSMGEAVVGEMEKEPALELDCKTVSKQACQVVIAVMRIKNNNNHQNTSMPSVTVNPDAQSSCRGVPVPELSRQWAVGLDL